ncbi:phenylalanine--tRNA ligase subunit beta [uncultured Pseudoteredinibacter sp.]|uniref:phenylalanine--tRNA ligase subunit beta n=1 Tax=uncultured Pseudoteredinibacter sp. TaxID=1641701 RepID=UPI00262827CF|nr:phenylalanine--tRNA ligase subunit beta [uncultured Pseudoteredinibacter sp.]
MKVSESWLREWVSPNISTEELVEQLTMAGLEVDAVEAAAGEFSKVVVGEIVSIEQHPDADKLRVCQVAGGEDELTQVVCGAPNARAGIKIPFALVGAKLPGDFKIKKAKLRGVESKGMLCAQTELQCGEDDDGIWELPSDAPVGTCLREYLNLDDSIIEVDLTPNRSDCLSMQGIARDVGVLNRAPVTPPQMPVVEADTKETLKVSLEAEGACPRYLGRVIRGVDLSKPSPTWMQEKLRRAGLRSIDAVVDVTNYVLLELGQPLHAFDMQKLSGSIHVRQSKAGEKLTLLDGQEVELKDNTLLICDGTGPVAMAGIMGGESTAVSSETTDVFLECAYFDPIAIAGRARSYGLHTDASHRYERGVDYQLQEKAIERATELLLEAVGGKVGPTDVTELTDQVPAERKVELRRHKIETGLGFSMADEEVVDILTRLGLHLVENTDNGWVFTVPSYRFDISIEADLLEELARVYGYNRLPTTNLEAEIKILPRNESKVGLSALRQQLVAQGFQEAICYSFIDAELQKVFNPEQAPIELQNPISADMAVMRTSLWPGLVQALQHNLKRQQSRAKLFETGLSFHSIEKQVPMLAGLMYGNRQPEGWSAKGEAMDFFDLKGVVEGLLDITDQDFRFVAKAHSALHPGQSAAIELNGEIVGYLGALHPQIQQELGLNQSVYLFEIEQAALAEAKLPAFNPLSKFPEVRRDLALLVARETTADALLDGVKAAAGEQLIDLKVFDVYTGKGIDAERKSVALGLTYQHPSRTLTEEEINSSVDAVVKRLEDELGASLR